MMGQDQEDCFDADLAESSRRNVTWALLGQQIQFSNINETASFKSTRTALSVPALQYHRVSAFLELACLGNALHVIVVRQNGCSWQLPTPASHLSTASPLYSTPYYSTTTTTDNILNLFPSPFINTIHIQRPQRYSLTCLSVDRLYPRGPLD